MKNFYPLFKTILIMHILILCCLFLSGNILAQLPDLIVSKIILDPEKPEEGDSVWVTAEIKNIGDAPTPADVIHGVRFNVDGGSFGNNAEHKSSMQPGDVIYVSPDPESRPETMGYWIVPGPGVYEISVEVDDYCITTRKPGESSYCMQFDNPACDNRICESDETNNITAIDVIVEGEFIYKKNPDLIITNITMEPENPKTGDEVVFSAWVKNQGDTIATSFTGYFGVNFMFGETRVTRTAYENMAQTLDAGESVKLTANYSLIIAGASDGAWKAVAGDSILTAIVDKDDNVTESIESNNTFNKTLYIDVHDSIKTADLIVENINFDPPDPVPYQAIFMSSNIVNQGPVYTKPIENNKTVKTDFFNSGLTISRTIGDQYVTDSIPAGDSVLVTANQVDYDLERDGAWFSKNEGCFIIKCKVDSWSNLESGRIKESDENNNQFQKTLVVLHQKDSKPLPDLVVTDLSWEPEEPAPGDSIMFTVTIENQGVAGTPDNRLLKTRLKVFDTTLYARTYSSLGVGETADMNLGKIKIPDTIQSNLVDVVVDTFPWFSIRESTKTNNILSSEISSLETIVPKYYPENSILLYPNPADDRLYLDYQTQKNETVNIRIMNLAGQIIYERLSLVIPGKNQLNISTGNMADGMYFINTIVSNTTINKKIIIKH